MTGKDSMLFRLSNAIDDPDSGANFFDAGFYWAVIHDISTEEACNEIVSFRSRPGIMKLPRPGHIGGSRP